MVNIEEKQKEEMTQNDYKYEEDWSNRALWCLICAAVWFVTFVLLMMWINALTHKNVSQKLEETSKEFQTKIEQVKNEISCEKKLSIANSFINKWKNIKEIILLSVDKTKQNNILVWSYNSSDDIYTIKLFEWLTEEEFNKIFKYNFYFSYFVLQDSYIWRFFDSNDIKNKWIDFDWISENMHEDIEKFITWYLKSIWLYENQEIKVNEIWVVDEKWYTFYKYKVFVDWYNPFELRMIYQSNIFVWYSFDDEQFYLEDMTSIIKTFNN